jgi:hypothetical protein
MGSLLIFCWFACTRVGLLRSALRWVESARLARRGERAGVALPADVMREIREALST